MSKNEKKDFIATHKLGMHSIKVNNELGLYSGNKKEGQSPSFVIDQLNELEKVLVNFTKNLQ